MTQTFSRPITPTDTDTNTDSIKEKQTISTQQHCITLFSPEEIKHLTKSEPLLMQENEVREYALDLDSMNKEIRDLYDKAKRSYWIPEEVDLSSDEKDMAKMTEKEKHLIRSVLAFFLRADNQIIENHATVFMREMKHNESILFLSIQIAIEAIHSEMYAILFDFWIRDPQERKRYLNAVDNFPGVQAKYQWQLEFQNSTKYHFGQRNFAFVISEGLFFSASFSVIFWLRSRGLLPGLSMSNDLTSRDEGGHVEYACTICNNLNSLRLTAEEAHAMMEIALVIEHQYIDDLAPESMEGMSADLLKQYADYVADWLLEKCNYPKLTNVSNPFLFMTLISLEGKTNFFERRNGDYSKTRTSKTEETQNNGGRLNENFDGELDW